MPASTQKSALDHQNDSNALTDGPLSPLTTEEPTPTEGMERIAPAADAVWAAGTDYVSKFQWVAQPGATWYHVFVSTPDYSTVFIDKWYTANQVCSGNICTTTDDIWLVGSGEFSWWMTYWSDAVGDDYINLYSNTSFTITMPQPGTVVTANHNAGVITWIATLNTLWYHVWVGPADHTMTSYTNWLNAANICAGGICSVNIGSLDANTYEFWLQGWNPAEVRDWYMVTDFTVAP